MTGIPAFDELERGHVVLAPDPFTRDTAATRPWLIINNDRHPFDGEQYLAMGMTTRTWYDARIPLTAADFRHRQAPKSSAIVPHAVASIAPELMTDYICRVSAGPIDRAVDRLFEYLSG